MSGLKDKVEKKVMSSKKMLNKHGGEGEKEREHTENSRTLEKDQI